jgi:hypothetical protein
MGAFTAANVLEDGAAGALDVLTAAKALEGFVDVFGVLTAANALAALLGGLTVPLRALLDRGLSSRPASGVGAADGAALASC